MKKNKESKNSNNMENKSIKHISFYTALIETMGYDPQRALLEVKLLNDGKIRQYTGVPESIWYQLRENYHPDTYFRRNICGCYNESIISDNEEPDSDA